VKKEDGTETEGTPFWLNWFDFFEAVRNPKKHDIENPDAGYATWALAKATRIKEEAEAEQEALRKAAEAPTDSTSNTSTGDV